MAQLIVPIALFGLALLVMRVATGISRRRRARLLAKPARNKFHLNLIHSINDDRCTGCEACVNVCPTDVLDLVKNHARPVRFDACIQCNQCEWVCPTKALVMHPPKEQPPEILLPHLDEYYQTNIQGLYLIGEAGGKPLTKNASNLGRAAVEHMRKTGLRPGGSRDGVDVLIIGSGPGGLSAALTCQMRGLSYAVIDKDVIPFSTVARYPKGKWVMAEPYDVRCVGLLPIWDAPKDDIVQAWSEIVKRSGVKVDLDELVQKFSGKLGHFTVQTSKRTLRAQRIIVATGTRGKPRKLGVPGEDLPKVRNLLDDPDEFKGRDVLVVGGGDSAAEAVLSLAEAGAKVTLSYRGKQIVRANPKNREKLEKLIAAKKVTAHWSSKVVEIRREKVKLKLESGQSIDLANDHVITLIGADPPIEWLKSMGVEYVKRPHMHAQPKSDELLERLLGRIGETTHENVYQVLGLEQAEPAPVPARRERERRHEQPDEIFASSIEHEEIERLPVIQARVIPLRRKKSAPPPQPEPAPEPVEDNRGGWFEEPTRTANPEEIVAARERAFADEDPLPRRKSPPPLPVRRDPTPPRPVRDPGESLSRAAREARARAHATGEIRTEKGEDTSQEKTTLAVDAVVGRLRSRSREDRPQLRSELAEASEDGQTRIHSPLGAWAGLAKLE